MLNKLILFCTFAIFVLAVGGVVTPLQAHCPDPNVYPDAKHSGDHPHCNVDSPPAESYPVYDVVIDGGYNGGGAILPGTGIGWAYDGKLVGSLNPRSDQLNISYFASQDFDTEAIATECFGTNINQQIPDWPEVKFGGILRKHGKSTAEGMFWFKGTTATPVVEVLYLLKIEGTFVGGINPLGFPKNDKIMHMTDWTLKVENQGTEVSSRSCVGSGKFPPSGFDVEFFDPTPEE